MLRALTGWLEFACGTTYTSLAHCCNAIAVKCMHVQRVLDEAAQKLEKVEAAARKVLEEAKQASDEAAKVAPGKTHKAAQKAVEKAQEAADEATHHAWTARNTERAKRAEKGHLLKKAEKPAASSTVHSAPSAQRMP